MLRPAQHARTTRWRRSRGRRQHRSALLGQGLPLSREGQISKHPILFTRLFNSWFRGDASCQISTIENSRYPVSVPNLPNIACSVSYLESDQIVKSLPGSGPVWLQLRIGWETSVGWEISGSYFVAIITWFILAMIHNFLMCEVFLRQKPQIPPNMIHVSLMALSSGACRKFEWSLWPCPVAHVESLSDYS